MPRFPMFVTARGTITGPESCLRLTIERTSSQGTKVERLSAVLSLAEEQRLLGKLLHRAHLRGEIVDAERRD